MCIILSLLHIVVVFVMFSAPGMFIGFYPTCSGLPPYLYIMHMEIVMIIKDFPTTKHSLLVFK